MRPHTENQKGERLGGGSILNAQWNHRLSRDVDVYLRLATKEDGRAILDRAARACNGYRVEHPNFPRIEFERDKDNHIDINLDPPKPGKGERMTVVDGEETPVLSNAQIMTGKLKGRGMTSPGRDVFDIAVCRIADPEALEVAVNSLDDVTLNGILTVYKITRQQYAKEARELDGVAEGLKPVQEDPVGYANDAILRRVRLFFVDGPRGFCQRHGKSYLTRRRRGGEGGGGGLLTGRAIPSAYRWAWCPAGTPVSWKSQYASRSRLAS